MKKIANSRQSRNLIFNLSLGAASAALAIAFLLTVAGSQPTQAQSYKVIHNFTGGQDGAYPYAGLTLDKAGNLYGTAGNGGVKNAGTVYKLTHKSSGWTFAPLFEFNDSDGRNPEARVVFGSNGTLYGTTTVGGAYSAGTVFNLKPPSRACTTVLCPWSETVLYSFMGGNDGSQPWFGDLLFDQSGNLYGTTILGGTGTCNSEGCGVVYELSPSGSGWAEKVLYSFQGRTGGGTDGSYPYAGVTFDKAGNLYGTSSSGGSSNQGTVFQLTHSGSSWAENVLYNFQDATDGGVPYTGLIFDQSGNLYGATWAGAPGGTVFELTLSGGSSTLSTLHNFTGAGMQGGGNLVMDGAGNLYGTTYTAGAFTFGNVWKLTPSGGSWTYTSLYDFTGGSDGKYPYGNVVFDASGNLYGTTNLGGSNGGGVVWEITP